MPPATDAWLLVTDQVPPPAKSVKVIVDPWQTTDTVAEMEPASGNILTVTTEVAVQPVGSTYETTAVPADTVAVAPETESIVKIPVAEEYQ